MSACYQALLGRAPDPAGVEYHVEQFLKREDPQEILESFFRSAEFKNRHWAMVNQAQREKPTDYYYLFHIPKTAGLTVKAYLGAALGSTENSLFAGSFIKDLLNQIEAIRKFGFFSGHFLGFLDALLGATTHKATLLRDPVERAISHYFHLLRDSSLPGHEQIKDRSIPDILTDERVRGFAVNFQAKYLAALADDANWLEHTLYFRAWPQSDAELLERARAGLALIDVVGLHEDLPDFFRRLAQQWPIRYSGTIPKVNVGDNRDDQLLSDADRQLIRELNAVDYLIYQDVSKRLRDS